ncbi:MAG: hypothetical protein PHI18_07925 [bacterium]|nr:hypothetical protein [bacterium]
METIQEPVEVIALFREGKLSPLRFRWRQRVYRVTRINGGWDTEEGATRYHHFAVMSESGGDDVFELSYNARAHHWRIEKVSLAG